MQAIVEKPDSCGKSAECVEIDGQETCGCLKGYVPKDGGVFECIGMSQMIHLDYLYL